MFHLTRLFGSLRPWPWAPSRLRRPCLAASSWQPLSWQSTLADAAPEPTAAAPTSPLPSASPSPTIDGVPPGFFVLAVVPRAEDGVRFHRYMLSGRFTLVSDATAPPSSLVYKWGRRRLLRAVAAGKELKDMSSPLPAGTAVVAHHSLQGQLQAGAGQQRDGSSSSSSNTNAAVPRWVVDCVVADAPDFLVISKPGNVATQGGSGVDPANTVDYWLPKLARLVAAKSSSSSSQSEGDITLRLVHRLDMRVSGLLLLAKTRAAAEGLMRAFQDHRIRKTYLAVVPEPLPPGVAASGTITAPVLEGSTAASGALRAAASGGSIGSAKGKATAATASGSATASTKYQALQLRLSSGDGEGHTITLLKLSPCSGRKHQLRQHVLHLFKGRCGIFGDDKYVGHADDEARRSSSGARSALRRLAGSELLLHSWHVLVPTSTLPGQTRAVEARSPVLPRGLAAVLTAAGWAPLPGKSAELLPPPAASTSPNR